LRLFQDGLADYRRTGAILGLPYYLGILAEAFTAAGRFAEARAVLDEALVLGEQNEEHFQEAELYRLRGALAYAQGDHASATEDFQRAIVVARAQGSRAWELRATLSLARLWRDEGKAQEALGSLSQVFEQFREGFETPDLEEAAELLREWRDARMRDDVAAGLRYVLARIPPPMRSPVSVDWRYIPSSTLGGDAIGYHWVDDDHLALYLVDVTGHGLDSALLSVTITNVISSNAIAGANPRHPDEVLAALNDAFQGHQHGYKFFTAWYGVYRPSSRELVYASGGHPSAIAVQMGNPPLVFPATGPVLGVSRGMAFPAVSAQIPPKSRLYIFSDGVYEQRRDHAMVWELPACIDYLDQLASHERDVLDRLLEKVRELHGSALLDDDFSVIEARL
jgi:tetratricopeptide (TPR) repeat protein